MPQNILLSLIQILLPWQPVDREGESTSMSLVWEYRVRAECLPRLTAGTSGKTRFCQRAWDRGQQGAELICNIISQSEANLFSSFLFLFPFPSNQIFSPSIFSTYPLSLRFFVFTIFCNFSSLHLVPVSFPVLLLSIFTFSFIHYYSTFFILSPCFFPIFDSPPSFIHKS